MKLSPSFTALLLPAGLLLANVSTVTFSDTDIPKALFPSIRTETTTLPHHKSVEVSKHNSLESCWVIISGNVYDLTTYIPINSTDLKMMEGCGQDVSSIFSTTTPPSTLHRYLIGTHIE